MCKQRQVGLTITNYGVKMVRSPEWNTALRRGFTTKKVTSPCSKVITVKAIFLKYLPHRQEHTSPFYLFTKINTLRLNTRENRVGKTLGRGRLSLLVSSSLRSHPGPCWCYPSTYCWVISTAHHHPLRSWSVRLNRRSLLRDVCQRHLEMVQAVWKWSAVLILSKLLIITVVKETQTWLPIGVRW